MGWGCGCGGSCWQSALAVSLLHGRNKGVSGGRGTLLAPSAGLQHFLPDGIVPLHVIPALPSRSGGVERSVLLWQPKGSVSRAVGELAGHPGGVQELVVADEQSQVGRAAAVRSC